MQMKRIVQHLACLVGVSAIGLMLPHRLAQAEAEPMMGEITLYAFEFAPRGWANANGQIMPIAQNQALFSLLGTSYGGNGQTTFALPNLRGRTPIGIGTANGLPSTSLGEPVGATTATLTQIPGWLGTAVTLETRGVDTSARTPGSVTVPHVTKSTVVGGSGTPFDLRPPSLGMNYSMALQGVYGNRADCLIGEIMAYAGTYINGNNWALANGQTMPIAQNTALFSILGTTYGGDGQTTFALPNLISRLPVGAGEGTGLSPVTLGETSGSTTAVLSVQHMPAVALSHQITTKNMGVNTSPRLSSNPIDVVLTTAPVSAPSGSVSIPIQPPSLGISYYICVNGVFPSRQ